MEHAQEILVIILSSFLAISILLSIILLILLIKVVLVVKRVTTKAEELADKAEAIGDLMHHASAPILMGKAFAAFTDKFFSKTSKRTRK